MRVYVSEDDSSVLNHVADTLEAHEHKVKKQIYVNNVLLDAVLEKPFDVYVLDVIQYWDYGGIKTNDGGLIVARNLRKISTAANALIIIMSADSQLDIPWLDEIAPAVFVDKSPKAGKKAIGYQILDLVNARERGD
jgi:DNA-binding response OmpR family regulator